jgi:hypothetical protein
MFDNISSDFLRIYVFTSKMGRDELWYKILWNHIFDEFKFLKEIEDQGEGDSSGDFCMGHEESGDF